MYGRRVVAEDAEVAVDAEVDRRRLDGALVERVDDDAALGERLADRDVGEDHAGQTNSAPAGPLLASMSVPRV